MQHSNGQDLITDGIIASNGQTSACNGHGIFTIEHVRDGEVIESFECPNLVVDQGLTYKVGSALLATTAITAWYVAPIDATPTIIAGNTYATHAGWAEITNYDGATRPVWTGVAGSVGVATNTASRAEFVISTGGAVIGGVALVGGGTDPTVKGNTAGGGTLFSASAFGTGNRTLLEADTLRVTYQYTFANTV